MGYIITSSPTAETGHQHHPCCSQAIGLTDGDRHADKLALFQRWACRGDKVAQDYADNHGEKNPDGQEAIEPAEGFESRNVFFPLGLFCARDTVFDIIYDVILGSILRWRRRKGDL